MSDSQQEVFDFLSALHARGEPPPRRIDTHAASVFLYPDRVLKVKQAVRFPFLDYSSLDKRKAACEAELAVNRPYAPQLYRRVVPIVRAADGSLGLGGAGTPVEWAVEMARFDEAATLDNLADRGGIDDALADALGRAVAAAHAQAPAVAAEPWISAVGAYVDEHVVDFGEDPDLFDPAAVEALGKAGRTAFARIRPLLEARGRRGLVRRCHGDLHLGNIVLIDGAPVLFDAIEFSDLIATGDVLYDVAFLLMDLHARGLERAANIVFNRYLAETERDADLDGLAALPYFLSIRAQIRAKVTARLQHDHSDVSIGEKARSYFGLARELIVPPQAQLIAIGGLSGTGKSLLARALAPPIAPVPGAVVLRSDMERKRRFAVGEVERLPPEAYTPEASAAVYAALGEKARRVLAAGHSVVLDAVFSRREEREAVAGLAKASGVPLHGLFLAADLAVRVKRVDTRTRDASDADADIATAQEGYDLGAIDWTRIDAGGTAEETLQHAFAAVGRGRSA